MQSACELPILPDLWHTKWILLARHTLERTHTSARNRADVCSVRLPWQWPRQSYTTVESFPWFIARILPGQRESTRNNNNSTPGNDNRFGPIEWRKMCAADTRRRLWSLSLAFFSRLAEDYCHVSVLAGQIYVLNGFYTQYMLDAWVYTICGRVAQT